MNLQGHFLLSVAASVLSVCLGAVPANAAGGEQGELRIKGPGSVYAGASPTLFPTTVTDSVAPGAAATYAFQVKNTGTDVAQYNIKVGLTADCLGACQAPILAVTAGSLTFTKLAQGANGYYTAPIQPGAVTTYALKVTPQKRWSTPGDVFFHGISLHDTTGANTLGYVEAWTNVARTIGSSPSDQFVSASGISPVSHPADNSYIRAVAPATVAVGGTNTWAVKLQNNTVLGATISYTVTALPELAGCENNYALTVKQGSTNITAAVLSGNYVKTLAAGASVTLTVSAKTVQDPSSCVNTHDRPHMIWKSTAEASGERHTIHLQLNVPSN